MTDLSTLDHMAALITRLETLGHEVGFNQAPAATARPYLVLYPINSPDHDGTLGDPDRWHTLQFQVTVVGDGPEQAMDVADDTDAVLKGTPLSVAGRSIWRIERDAVGDLRRDDNVQPPLHYCTPSYSMTTTPA